MANYLVEYQLRIRNRADSSDLLTVTSVRSGTNPHIESPPRGDGATVDPMGNSSLAASYTLRIVDVITSGTSRVLTAKLEDVNERLQLGYLKAYVESRIDGGAWTPLCVGFVTLLKLVDAITWEITVQDATRVQGGVDLYNAQSTTLISTFLAAFPNRGCLYGGPIIGSFLQVQDSGGWTMRVVDSTPAGATATRYRLAPRRVFGPGNWSVYANIKDIAGPINEAVRSIPRGVFNFATKALSTIADLESQMTWRGLIMTIDGVYFRPIDPFTAGLRYGMTSEAQSAFYDIVSPDRSGEGVFAFLDGQTPLTIGSDVRVRCFTVLPSEVSPIYIDQHPLDLLGDVLALAGLEYDTTARDALKAVLGNDLKIALRITETQQMGELLRSAVFEPFEIGIRIGSTGKIVPFSTAIFANTPPTRLITDALVVDGSTRLPFELDVTAGLQRITYHQRRFITNGKKSPDGIYDGGDAEVTALNGDADALRSGTIEIDVPGMIHTSRSGNSPVGFDWLVGIAQRKFDRFGRGCQALETSLVRGDGTTDADLLQLGDEALINIKQLPNHNKRLGDDGTVGSRAMQLVRVTEFPAHREVRFLDSGPNAQPLSTKPTHTIAKSTDLPRTVALLTITNAATLNGLGYAVRIQMAATSGGAPAAGDYVDVITTLPGAIPTGAIRLPSVPHGSTVYAQARSELVGHRPSDYQTAVSVALDAIAAASALSATAVGTDGSLEDLAWTNGSNYNPNDFETDIYLRASGAAFSTAIKQRVLINGSTRFRLEELTPNTAYTASVQYRDVYSGEVSALTEVTFTTANVTKTLTAPLAPAGFSGRTRILRDREGGVPLLDDIYGLAVMATEFPGYVDFYEAVETSIGSGTYGSFNLVQSIASVSGDWTTCTRYAPFDGLRRQMKAKHSRIGTTSSSFTSTITISPWVMLPLILHAEPQATITIEMDGPAKLSLDGPLSIGSYKYDYSTSAFPSDSSVESGGTTLDGRVQNNVTLTTLTLGQRIYVTVVPFSGPSATGAVGASIHISASFQDFSATKTVRFSSMRFRDADQYNESALEFTSGYATFPTFGITTHVFATGVDTWQGPDGATLTKVEAELFTGDKGGGLFDPTATISLDRMSATGGATNIGSAQSVNHNGWETKNFTCSESTTGRQYRVTIAFDSGSAADPAPRIAAYYVTYTVPSDSVTL